MIDKVEKVDNEIKLLNVVFDVAFKLLIDKIELVEMNSNYSIWMLIANVEEVWKWIQIIKCCCWCSI